MSELKVNKISPRSGTAITLGDSGDTFTIPSGATLAIAGSVTGFTSAGIDDNATSVAITIDSSERVGIGTTSPANTLDVNSSAGAVIKITRDSQSSYLQLSTDGSSGQVFSGAGALKFKTGSSEAGRFDTSGDLLIGKTSISTNAVGVALTGSGLGAFTRSGDAPIIANRTTSDGDIALFRKNNTTLGRLSITSTPGFAIGTPHNNGSGLHLISNAILPSTSSGGTADNLHDLGASSSRFKNLYLGGQALVSSQSTGTPSFAFVNDPDTGISRPTTNALNICTGGSERVRINADGALLAGTTSSLQGTSHSFQALGTSNSFYAGAFKHTGSSAAGRVFSWQLPNTNSSSSYFVYATNSDGNCFNIFGNGNTEIRNSSPLIATVDTGDSNAVTQISGDAGWLQLRADNNNNVSGTNITFSVDGSEKARIDSSGRFLLAKTSTAIGDVGISLDSNGKISATRSSDPVFLLNRLSSDGTIADFRKDGTSVGSIGVLNSDNPYFQGDATNHGGLQCGTNTILPCKSAANSDNTIDLGQSDIRWKDIYLSGGAFIGGTGSANKLDDYEEGTFSPSISGNLGGASGVNFNIRNGFYTKVGRAVFFHIHIDLSSWTSGPSGSSTTINGLPFTNENTTGNNASVYIGQCNSWSGSAAPQGGYIQPNETRIILMTNDSSDARDNLNTSINTSTISGDEEIRIAGYYQTA